MYCQQIWWQKKKKISIKIVQQTVLGGHRFGQRTAAMLILRLRISFNFDNLSLNKRDYDTFLDSRLRMAVFTQRIEGRLTAKWSFFTYQPHGVSLVKEAGRPKGSGSVVQHSLFQYSKGCCKMRICCCNYCCKICNNFQKVCWKLLLKPVEAPAQLCFFIKSWFKVDINKHVFHTLYVVFSSCSLKDLISNGHVDTGGLGEMEARCSTVHLQRLNVWWRNKE